MTAGGTLPPARYVTHEHTAIGAARLSDIVEIIADDVVGNSSEHALIVEPSVDTHPSGLRRGAELASESSGIAAEQCGGDLEVARLALLRDAPPDIHEEVQPITLARGQRDSRSHRRLECVRGPICRDLRQVSTETTLRHMHATRQGLCRLAAESGGRVRRRDRCDRPPYRPARGRRAQLATRRRLPRSPTSTAGSGIGQLRRAFRSAVLLRNLQGELRS